MFIRQHDSFVRVHAPAKLNLFLEILAKRTDGFHEIETLMAAINRFDTLTFSPCEGTRIELKVADSGSADGGLPSDPQQNLVFRALHLLQQRSGCEQGGTVRLTKRIPPASGLGGGSSDAAAALLAGNIGWKLKWSRVQLAALAAELGSDVPFFLLPPRGNSAMMAVCRGRGEVVQAAHAPAGMHFVIARPALGLSTPEVYRHCQPAGTPRSVDEIVQALKEGNQSKVRSLMTNRLQSAAASMTPVVTRLAQQFDRQGAIAHQLSGSGSAYFGWFANANIAKRAASRLRAAGIQFAWHAQAI